VKYKTSNNVKFLLNINTKRYIDLNICKNNEKLLNRSLEYESFFFNKNNICVKNYFNFILFEE
jgi:hypothetical protein